MKVSRSVLLFLKGCCMGAADVIPGVSGGTIALIVGIYRELIASLKSLNLAWIKPSFQFVFLGGGADALEELKRKLGKINLGFLLPLGLGILSAILLGSLFIPALLSNYPVAVKALFFGLILASVWIPFQMVDAVDGSKALVAFGVGIVFVVLGFLLSNPNFRMAGSVSWVSVKSSGTSFEALLEEVPSSRPAHRVYWHSRNRAFRKELRRLEPELAEELRSLRNRKVESLSPKDSIKARSEPYETIQIPEGLSVEIPRLSYWYVFVVGAVAISAMVLPGISGSYILLILGSYFYVLNSLGGFLDGFLSGTLLRRQGLVLLLFGLGAAVGLLVFTRVLDYLLRHWKTLTAAGLSGLMLGCLRGVWPFQRMADGTVQLFVPDRLSGTVFVALIMFALGFLVVFALNLMPSRSEASGGEISP